MTDDIHHPVDAEDRSEGDHSGPSRRRNYPRLMYNLAGVCSATGMIVFFGTLMSGLASTALFIFGFVLLLCGGYLALKPPVHRFEIGTYPASHQYNGVTIDAVAVIRWDDDNVKRRTVEVAAVAEDGTTIVHESDTEAVGTKPDAGLDGGDFDGVRSTTDHILAVSSPVREYVDEWIASEGNDLAVKTALETEFGTTNSEMEQTTGAKNL